MLDISKIYTSNKHGDLKVINYINSTTVEIEFLSTGYKTTTTAGQIVIGQVMDYLHPSVSGIGFIGEGSYMASINGKATSQYRVWSDMINRCYNPSTQERQPTYINCSVDTEWHNFQVFAKWFDDHYVDGFHLDKDIKVDGNKVYSSSTCAFVSRKDNNAKAQAKRYTMISPEGVVTHIHNLSEFCRKNSLNQGRMSQVNAGIKAHHKNWVKA